MRKPGRQKKPVGERRDNILQIGLTQAEFAAVQEAAHSLGLDTSAWVRMLCLRELKAPAVPPVATPS